MMSCLSYSSIGPSYNVCPVRTILNRATDLGKAASVGFQQIIMDSQVNNRAAALKFEDLLSEEVIAETN